jgi:hypothetical protein
LPYTPGKVFFVINASDNCYADFEASFPADGDGVKRVYATIQTAIDAARVETDPSAGHVILVKAREIAAGATDPTSWAETLTIYPTQANLTLQGMTQGNAQGRLPQIKKGSGSTALLTIQAPGCLVKDLGFNGGSSTGGGILLDDDSSTKCAFGTVIEGCHFKNCVGSTATDCRTGGAIMWTSAGNAWQVVIRGNTFYKNVGDIVLKGTSNSVPQDIIIENNNFVSASTSATDCNIYLAGGSGVSGLIIRGNHFGAQPALSSGSIALYMDLTGCYGLLSDNFFGDSGTIATSFSATGSAAVIPTTVFMAGNYCETGLITR